MTDSEESHGSHAGRPRSWFSVSVIFLGFLIGGLALPLGPVWPMFWAGGVVIVLGCLLALFLDLFGDVVLAVPRAHEVEIVDTDLFGHEGHTLRGGGHGDPTGLPVREDAEHFPHG
ncbi:HGxxPAAW family protein [Actinocorallia longicatena]|uniref:Uncharacterized protein n=1 Tax=Actinocorallia longicatena TaxID=111803 RepID=A0ABP6QKG1_9ACTN